jgi:O-antigen/teichoic acid export membrane protein
MSSPASAVEGDSGARQPFRPFANLLSINYFLLRVFTAGAAVVSGLVQTFVFARVLAPRDFSIFILIGTFGVALWMFELGATRILYVRHRARHLGQKIDDTVAAQSNAILLLYAFFVLAGTVLCFAIMANRPSTTLWLALQFAAFMSFSALNLVWFPLRLISSAVDEFIRYETLEVVRRVGYIGLMMAMLLGLPMPAFLVLVNLLWAYLLYVCIARLVRRGALAARLRGSWDALLAFWREHRAAILGSGIYASGEIAIYNYPYFVVPIAFGLAAPTIILDTVFKIFRGATLVYAAGLDPLVPRQTRAFAEGDIRTLKKATWTAALLCAVPTFAICGLLLFDGERLFALLLGPAATMPRSAALILVVLLLANLAQNVASNLLLHTGFFREMARVAGFLVVTMAVMTAVVIAAGADVMDFIGGYTVVYLIGAGLYLFYVKRKVFSQRKAAAGLAS